MASDTSNLFSKAEVREIKRFTKGNITLNIILFIMTIFQLYLQLPKKERDNPSLCYFLSTDITVM